MASLSEDTLIQRVMSKHLAQAGHNTEPEQLRDELLNSINNEVYIENRGRGPGGSLPKLRSHQVLPEYAVAIFLLEMGNLGLIQGTGRRDPARIVVIHKGLAGWPVRLEDGEAAITRAIYALRPSAKTSNVKEIVRILETRAPIEFKVEETCSITKYAGGGSRFLNITLRRTHGIIRSGAIYPVPSNPRLFTTD